MEGHDHSFKNISYFTNRPEQLGGKVDYLHQDYGVINLNAKEHIVGEEITYSGSWHPRKVVHTWHTAMLLTAQHTGGGAKIAGEYAPEIAALERQREAILEVGPQVHLGWKDPNVSQEVNGEKMEGRESALH
ncbi:MAG: hypothetical protein M2R45_03319 [Verrucomicrobia subdivision 3 bacterium]|nr:hypothetical protein [Limisphaerales bacterium]MCS1415402.1 hypothetical protein [Limisphaerales bacterium]